MNNHPLDARLVLASPTVKKDTVDRDPTRARENPQKKEANAVRNQIQKACDDRHIEKKENLDFPREPLVACSKTTLPEQIRPDQPTLVSDPGI
jgi:hypothetical protein